MADAPGLTTESPKAAQAFADYIALPSKRTLRDLADLYVEQNRYRTASTALRILADWSVKYCWQERIANAATAQAERMLQEAADLDADTFLHSSRILNKRMRLATSGHVDMVVKVRESVRKPAPKGGASVSVTISVEVRQLAERLAKDLGMSPEELIADAEKIAAGAWGSP